MRKKEKGLILKPKCYAPPLSEKTKRKKIKHNYKNIKTKKKESPVTELLSLRNAIELSISSGN